MSAVLQAQEPSARYLAAEQPALVRQFELLATAPGGVGRLRELILSLAVQGRLVPQDPSDAPASALLVRVQARRKQLVAEGKIKASKSEAPSADQDVPFVVPASWEWICAAEACVVVTDGDHQAPPRADSGVPFLVIGDVRDGAVGLGSATRFVPREYFDALDWGKRPLQGDILYTTVGSLGIPVPVVQQQAFCFQRHIALLRPGLPELQAFLTLALQSRLAFDQAENGATGIAQKTVPLSVLRNLRLPLPPLAEQSRIVARVDELMRLCDALEAKGRLEAEQHARLLGTLLGTLTDSSTPEELAANWQRVAHHFDLLLDRPEAVDALEQTILQLAVRGLLVQQDPSDESASELVRRIRSYRDEQVKSGLAKRERPFTPLSEADLPFELPTGWEWIRFDDLIEPAKPISYGVLVPGPDIDRGVPFVRIADLSLTDPPVKPEKSISTEVDAQYQRTRLEGGEILMGVVGSIGKLGVAPPSWAGANIARAICRIVPVGLVDYGFVLLLLQSEFMRDSFAGDTRTLAQPTLNVGLIRSSATPLPPIAEQARIVARVTELRRFCADLRQRLTSSQTTQSQLAEALVESAAA